MKSSIQRRLRARRNATSAQHPERSISGSVSRDEAMWQVGLRPPMFGR